MFDFRKTVLFCGLLLAGACPAAEIDVYLIGGQSNAAGRALISNVVLDPGQIGSNTAQLTNTDVRFYYSETVDANAGATPNAWTTLQPAAQFEGYFGPEIGLGNRLAELYPDRTIALIKHAKGSTSLASDWNPTGEGGAQWQLFVQTVQAGLQALIDEGHTPVLRGMVWQQGETDANSESGSEAYGSNLKQFIAAVREEFSAPDMAFVYGTILQKESRPFGAKVRAGQEAVDEDAQSPLSITGANLINADDLKTNYNNDLVHFDYISQIELGKRFAEELGSVQVPEPNSFMFLGTGGLLLFHRARGT